MILSSEPGMGKSTFMTKLANTTKKEFRTIGTKWIVRIKLNECTTALEDINCVIDKDKAIKFLLGAENIESDFEVAFFKHFIEKQRGVVLFIDGFDEISPHYKQKVLDLILAYQTTEIENIWITTRPHLKQELEDKFGTFAYTLKPLSLTDQESLIKMFWYAKIGEIPPDKKISIEDYVPKIRKLFIQSIGNTNAAIEFAAVPLQTLLLAKYFYYKVKAFCTSENVRLSLPPGLNILDLYEQFIDKKIKVYCTDKKRQNGTIVANMFDDILLSDIFIMRHEGYALDALFSEAKNSPLNGKYRERATVLNETDDGIQRTGITIGIVNQRPAFIHRTFAEYFAANWFAKNLHDSVIKEFLRKVLFESGNEILRNFFDRILCKDKCELHCEVLNRDKTKMEPLLLVGEVNINALDKGGRTALHLAAACGDKNAVMDLLKGGADASVRDELFGWCAAIYADRSTKLDIAIMLLKEAEKELETLKIIEEYDQLLNTPNRYAPLFVVQASLDCKSLSYCIEIKNTLLHIAVGKDDLKFVDYLIRNGFCFKVGNSDGQTPFHDAAENGSKQIVERFVKFCSYSVDGSDLKKSEMVRDLINMTDKEGHNSLSVCFSSSGNCEEVCEYLIQTYDEALLIMKQSNPVAYFNELESFFNSKNIDGDTPLLIACENESTKCGQLWVKKYNEYTSKLKAADMYYDQLDSFFNVQNKTGFTPLLWAVTRCELEFVEYLTKSYSKALAAVSSDIKLNQKKLLAFLNGVDNEGNNPLFWASRRMDDDGRICEYLIQTTISLMEENIDAYRDGLKKLFNHRNDDGDTPIAKACEAGNLNCVNVLMKKYVACFKFELNAVSVEQYCNEIHDFFRNKNKYGLTPLHLVVDNIREYKLDIVKCLVESYSDILVSVNPADSNGNRDKLLAFLNETDKYGHTPLCLASKTYYSEICDYLISKTLSILLPLEGENPDMYRDGLRKLFYHTNSNGDTRLALAFAGGVRRCIKVWISRYIQYIEYIKIEDESKREVLKRYLETTNKNEMTPLTYVEYWLMDLIKSYDLCICSSANSCDKCS
jgi:ankyrin repeat protein